MGASLDRGYSGEQDMGFYWGERGYFLVDGPSGAAGHAGNAAGFDGVAYNPTTGHLVIYDNKSFARAGNVYDASAITKNFSKNLDGLIGRVQALNDMPQQQQILAKLSTARAAVDTPTGWPKGVEVAVSNAGGQSTGVGTRLGNASISFINFNAAPSPKPAPPPAGSPTSASRGAAWSGPGGTPGFNPSRVQGYAAALKELMGLAEKLSMMIAAREAWGEFLERESEVVDIQNSNPMYPTWIAFTFTYALGNGEQPKIYKYLPPMDIKSGGTKPPQIGDDRMYSIPLLIPALKAGPTTGDGGAKFTGPAWWVGYTSLKDALQGDPNGWRAEDPARAHQVLNGAPMYDMLKMLKKLRSDDERLFRLLENTVGNPYGVNNSRNAAAIVAVRMADNASGDTLGDYKAKCKEFAQLLGDQQTDIENFLGGKVDAEVAAVVSPVGSWNVRISKYFWVYKFDAGGTVSWRDPYNGMNGKGRWKVNGATMAIDWSPSKSWDRWDLPFDDKQQSGMAFVNGEGTFKVNAQKV